MALHQHKFWAIAFSLNKLVLYVVPIIIIVMLIAINIDSIQYFLYLWIGIMLTLIVVSFLLVKRVRITLHENEIRIRSNGKKEFVTPIEDFQYVRGVNINLPQSQGEMNLVFRNQIITFNIFDMRGIGNINLSKHCEILKSIIETYNLEDSGQDKKHLSKLHLYRNPKYKR